MKKSSSVGQSKRELGILYHLSLGLRPVLECEFCCYYYYHYCFANSRKHHWSVLWRAPGNILVSLSNVPTATCYLMLHPAQSSKPHLVEARRFFLYPPRFQKSPQLTCTSEPPLFPLFLGPGVVASACAFLSFFPPFSQDSSQAFCTR